MEKFLCLFVLFVYVHLGSAVKCYNCQSNATVDCNDYTKMDVVECLPVKDQLFTPVCIRRVLKSESGLETTLLCSNRHVGNECDPPSIRYNVTQCRICQENLCNHKSRSEPSLNLVSILGLSLLIYITKRS